MVSQQIPKKIKLNYLNILSTYGEVGLFQRAVGDGIIKSASIKDIDIKMLNLSEAFLGLFRRTGDDNFASISRAIRRAAHAVNRQLMRQDADRKHSKRFLYVV